MEFWKKHQATSLEEAKELLHNSHKEVMDLAQSFSNEELFSAMSRSHQKDSIKTILGLIEETVAKYAGENVKADNN